MPNLIGYFTKIQGSLSILNNWSEDKARVTNLGGKSFKLFTLEIFDPRSLLQLIIFLQFANHTFVLKKVCMTFKLYAGSSRLMRISLLRFFKTFHIYLANAIIIFFILLLRFYVYFANVILCAIYFVSAIIQLM